MKRNLVSIAQNAAVGDMITGLKELAKEHTV